MIVFYVLLAIYLWGTPIQMVKRYDGDKIVMCTAQNEEQMKIIESWEDAAEEMGMDVWKIMPKQKKAMVHVAKNIVDKFKAKCKAHGITVNILNENIQQSVDKELEENQRVKEKMPKLDVVGRFARHNEINSYLIQQAKLHRNIASIINIGKSYEGRDMLVIKIGQRYCTRYSPWSRNIFWYRRRLGGRRWRCKQKAAIWLDAGFHAREWVSITTATYIIQMLLDDTNPEIRLLLNQYDWYILPVGNPDGYEYSHTNDRFWRKDRVPPPPDGNNLTCIGTDPNRNWGFHFGETGVNMNTCAPNYLGPRAFSSNCTNNTRNFIFRHRQKFRAYLSLHSFGQLLLTPWGYTLDLPEDNDELIRVAEIGEEAIENENGREFLVGSPAVFFGPTSGGSFDWAKGTANITYSYTFELFPTFDNPKAFVIDVEDIEPAGREAWESIKVIVKATRPMNPLVPWWWSWRQSTNPASEPNPESET